MKYYKVVILLSTLVLSFSANAKKPILIDSELKKQDAAMNKKSEVCMKIKDFMDQTDCLNEVIDQAFDAPIRGTKEYCENNYLSKSFKEREIILKRLKENQKVSRSLSMRGIDRKEGEVTAEMLQTEILIVEDSLARNQSNSLKKTNFDLFGR